MPRFPRERKPTNIPCWFFPDGTRVGYASAVRADTNRQDFSVEPRHWYVDATIRCDRCKQDFLFSADEQRFWYEELRFYVDSFPRKCSVCRGELRRLKALRQQYDQQISQAMTTKDTGLKLQAVSIIDAMAEAGLHLPDGVRENRRTLLEQVQNLGDPGGPDQ